MSRVTTASVPAILLDLDDTLMDDRRAMALGVLAFRRDRGFALNEPDEVVAHRWDSVGRFLWSEWAAGRTTLVEQRRERLRRTFGLTISDAEADSLFDEYLAHYEQHWQMLEGTPEFLAKTAHHPRAIVTNGRRSLALRKLQRVGLASGFQVVVTPDDCGFRKPQPGIFLHALALIGVRPEQAIMVGDNLASDIEPALRLGMRAFHVCPGEGRAILQAADAIQRPGSSP